ncbi:MULTISPECIES: acryloyl-CoA reductase [unclassified Polynucleobacter]|uniref:acrylyl-CoA reductase family protein n=1 Tax=unclassified Polynucleobacter TaxID=2640945 RepID=UPI001F453B3E|nr:MULTISPECIES: acryloyl-CoA reductase [unclassified Polynucleobacter]MCE7528225.1 acryloyl-CoA reductase [Polynucleobacter sp. IMCC 30228]MCE7530332.1 acryloyl-CoA reductase [Polynucleobacter sp. IMCC 29146]
MQGIFKAFRLHSIDGVVTRKIESIQLDSLSPGNVIIKVAFSSINYKDALASKGLNNIVREWPRISGIDLTGIVVESHDLRFSPGDEVLVNGCGIGVDHDGGHAEYARVNADWVMKLPSGLTLLDAATIGVAGYTAGLSLDLMELNGLNTQGGPILVTGATGGVATIAIDMLSQRGYQVTAMSGKPNETAYLKNLGASEVIGRISPESSFKPLEKAQWAGAIDSVGGYTLSWLTRVMQTSGIIAAFGNAGGAELDTTVVPFILRGIRLIGINANSPMNIREKIWKKIANEYRPTHLKEIASIIGIEKLAHHLDLTLAGKSKGRIVIDMTK